MGRAELVRQWADALISTAYVPASRQEVERFLRSRLDSLFEVLAGEGFSPGPCAEVGELLVARSFVGEHSLSRTIEVLGRALPASPELQETDALPARVVSTLGAVAAGYAMALRAHVLGQQEEVKRALLKAKQDAERGLRVSEERFRELFTSSAVGIAISDLDGNVVESNSALAELVGRSAAELVGRSLYELFHPEDAARLRTAYRELVEQNERRSRLPWRLRLVDNEGETARTYLAVSLLHDADGKPTHHVLMVEDVTELHLLGEQLSYQSLHDIVTGLPNQQFFISSLEGALGRTGQDSRIILCKIDLDGFAVVNDGLGREIGDRLLRSVAARLQSVVAGEKAAVARFGADEFAILIESSATRTDVGSLAARIDAELAEPVYIEGHGLAVSACIGVVEHHGGGIEPAELLRQAEATLHGIRGIGTRQWALFDARRDADRRSRSRLAAAMPGAWESGEISLEYQPLRQSTDDRVVGVEAQFRWDHPQRGRLPHRECLELAAWTGLAVPLGQWMLSSACDQLASWRHGFGDAAPLLHVDLTPQQAQAPDLVATARCALQQAGLGAQALQLGIPVLALDAEPGEAEDNLRVLADLGVSTALLGCSGADDIAHLEDLPVRAVEVAQRLVRRVAQRRHGDSAAARAIADLLPLVHALGAVVIVRGIESQEAADWWRSAGADIVQGGFIAPPAPPEEIAALLGDR